MRRRTAVVVPYVVLGLVLVAMLMPPLRDPPRDSYPLSTYPMFSRDRGRMSSVATVVAVDGAGADHRLSPRLIGGTDEVMLAVVTASRAVRAGPERAAGLCEQVAERVARSARSTRDDLVAVEVRTELHDAVDYFTGGDRRPLHIERHARCDVHDGSASG